ncbi:MAG: aminodeoxychorismate synthase component I [Verrucomicrobiales bacterium]|nr:aminodeoxychorismate synthase component I [Verrucomicrobiales bacterium]
MNPSVHQHQVQRIELDYQPLELARGLVGQPGFIFLDSASSDTSPTPSAPRAISILASDPEKIIQGKWKQPSQALQELKQALQVGKAQCSNSSYDFPTGGAVGSFDYDGSFCFGIYPQMLIYDHLHNQWFEVGEQQNKIDWSQVHCGENQPATAPFTTKFASSMTREDFCQRVQQAQAYIAAGDIYQVNLSHQFSSPWQCSQQQSSLAAFTLYQQLRSASPAPFAAYLNLNHRQILSSSPELFLKISGREITTRPIKGTRPRFHDPAADQRSANQLITSPKEIAELIMITDLERNDLGKICEPGSVQVSELLKLESFEQVFHLVSTVEGTLKPPIDPIDALLSCFPGGSITGAPKIRAMQIIEELESTPRGLYTGAIGIFGFNDQSLFNIAIRTAVIENQSLHFHVGAGIVADSIAEKEYQETLHKARGIFLACGENI